MRISIFFLFFFYLTHLLGQQDAQSMFFMDPNSTPVRFKHNSIKLHYDTSSRRFGQIAADEGIKELAKTLKERPEIVVQITAYCDPTERFPNRLSIRRAKYLKRKLLRLTIEADRITSFGGGVCSSKYGGLTDEESFAANRHAIFTALSYSYSSTKKNTKRTKHNTGP